MDFNIWKQIIYVLCAHSSNYQICWQSHFCTWQENEISTIDFEYIHFLFPKKTNVQHIHLWITLANHVILSSYFILFQLLLVCTINYFHSASCFSYQLNYCLDGKQVLILNLLKIFNLLSLGILIFFSFSSI